MFALLADDGRGEHICSKCGQGRVPTFTAPIIMRPPAFCIATVSLSLSLSLSLSISLSHEYHLIPETGKLLQSWRIRWQISSTSPLIKNSKLAPLRATHHLKVKAKCVGRHLSNLKAFSVGRLVHRRKFLMHRRRGRCFLLPIKVSGGLAASLQCNHPQVILQWLVNPVTPLHLRSFLARFTLIVRHLASLYYI